MHTSTEHSPSLTGALNQQHLLNNGFPGKFIALIGFCSLRLVLRDAGDLRRRGLIMINLTLANR